MVVERYVRPKTIYTLILCVNKGHNQNIGIEGMKETLVKDRPTTKLTDVGLSNTHHNDVGSTIGRMKLTMISC